MNDYIATFYTHFAALCSFEKMSKSGIGCVLAPVPRFLSSSCGTCVKFSGESAHEELMHEDLEQLVRLKSASNEYEIIKEGCK